MDEQQQGCHVDVTFAVTVSTEPGQCVCVTGDDDRLGAWNPARMVRMTREFTGNGCRKLWTATIRLQRQKTYHYRYVVCKESHAKSLTSPECAEPQMEFSQTSVVPNGNGHALDGVANGDGELSLLPFTVYKWETNVKPRVLALDDCGESLILPESTFGTYGGLTNINKGWLINQSEFQLRLHSDPIQMWKPRHREQTYSIKCIAVDYSQQGGPPLPEDDDDSRDSPPHCQLTDVYACNVSDHEMCVAQPQGPVGLICNRGDYIVFRTQTPDPGAMGFQLDFYVCESNRAPKFVGSAHLLPNKQNDSLTKRKVPIIGCKYRPIGEVTVECLLAKPVPGLTMKLDSSYQTHRKLKDLEKGLERSLDIGHRGMGASYSRVSMLKENTVASFVAAGRHGADFVEFDVLLSKDKTPVVYHDFAVKVLYSNKKHHSRESELFEIPVQSLTLAQLQSMRLFSGEQNVEINLEQEEDSVRHDPFPTLEEVLTSVDESLGFNIEIKYPQQLEDDTWEMENCVDPNENLDHILTMVFAHAGARKIVFSSFDPDTCILLKLKQNKYPVMFLHQGQTNIYTRYKDHRASTFEWGINFALSEHLLGLALHTEVLLRDVSLLERMFAHKMVVFVWGDDNNDPHIIRRMRSLKVDGVIYDRIDCHKPEHQGPEFELSSAKDAAAFMEVVEADGNASVHICDDQGQLSEAVP